MALINVVHAMPKTSSAYGIDHDGFTAAMEVVGRRHEIRWLNVHPYNDDHREQRSRIADADFVLARSDWPWLPCEAADQALFGRPEIPVGLLIAGSSAAPVPPAQARFDVLFHETPWYAPFVAEHPFAVQAFGIDTRSMYNRHAPDREIDWLAVGRLARWKRADRLLGKEGRRLAVGDTAAADPAFLAGLRRGGVEIRDQVSYEELAGLYNSTKNVLVACPLQGGGERAVWEARACGCNVEIAPDNPKLASLLTIPVEDHESYGRRLADSIEEVLDGRTIDPRVKVEGQRLNRWNIWSDKLRRAPATARIRAENLSRRWKH